MKKILFLLAIALPLVFASCSKDEEDNLDSRLVNTKWQTRDIVYEAFYGGTAYNVYEFISNTEVESYTTKNDRVVDTNGTFKYTLSYPNLTINEGKDSDGKEKIYKFEFKDSRTIVRKGANEYSAYMKYIKQ